MWSFLTRESLFAVAWRVAVLALPWQTRWIIETPTIAGSPWEQGTIAIYASWIPIACTILIGLWNKKQSPTTHDPSVHSGQAPRPATFFSIHILSLIAILTLIITSLFTTSLTATLLWWMHATLLALFAWTLWRQNVTRMEISAWFVAALVPHALLGIWQFLEQTVYGSTLLGIADQRAWVRGTSVIEYGEIRMLRAYGGFSHPNVFGGWLTAGLLCVPALVAASQTVREKFCWIGCASLFMMALVFTMSRGAWIAALMGLVLAFGFVWKQFPSRRAHEATLTAVGILMAIATLCIATQWDAVSTRFKGTERLERWSMEQRVTSLRDGWEALRQHPLVGWGPGAALVGMDALGREPAPTVATFRPDGSFALWRAPLEPPHAAPLTMLVELGTLGIIALMILLFLAIRALIRRKAFIQALPWIASLGVLSLTDHYLLTLWAGQSLAMFMILVPFLLETKPNFHHRATP